MFTPMDEASMVALDISGEPYLHYDVGFTGQGQEISTWSWWRNS